MKTHTFSQTYNITAIDLCFSFMDIHTWCCLSHLQQKSFDVWSVREGNITCRESHLEAKKMPIPDFSAFTFVGDEVINGQHVVHWRLVRWLLLFLLFLAT